MIRTAVLASGLATQILDQRSNPFMTRTRTFLLTAFQATSVLVTAAPLGVGVHTPTELQGIHLRGLPEQLAELPRPLRG